MRYTVNAMGVNYAEFRQATDAQEWALAKSKQHTTCWWEVRDEGQLEVAFQDGRPVYGENYVIINT